METTVIQIVKVCLLPVGIYYSSNNTDDVMCVDAICEDNEIFDDMPTEYLNAEKYREFDNMIVKSILPEPNGISIVIRAKKGI